MSECTESRPCVVGSPCEAWWSGFRSWTLVVLKAVGVITATLCAWDIAKAAIL